ncbi:MAG: YicC/YloC family endoribonuclease, partial [Bacillota bacterium]|nr:YicC/YloC family endoribonuclease [Bacillota bacterium]
LIHIEESESANEELEDTVLNAVEQATIQLMNMRNSEGEELLKDIASHLKQLEAYVNGLRQFAPSVILNYKERLSKKMIEFLNGQMDEARILTEVALFADKADITEELTRLSSHILQFSNILDSTETIGRKLDFLVQEMNREVNTIGSKANDPHIAVEVIEMKSLLEKMKEQIQNIE